MAVYYCKSGAGAVDYSNRAWATGTPGDRMVPTQADVSTNYTVARRWVWECTVAGTSTTTPTWPASVSQDTQYDLATGGTERFTARKPGFSSGTTANWAYATPYLNYAATAATATGDIVYVSNNHNETQSAAYTVSSGAISMLCVDDAATPPTTLATTATITTTTGTILFGNNVGGMAYGLNLIAGSGSAAAANVSVAAQLDTCTLQVATTNTSSVISFGLLGTPYIRNCQFKFAVVQQSITLNTIAIGRIEGCSFMTGSAQPTTLISAMQASNETTFISGCDFSAGASTMHLCGTTATGRKIKFIDCKLPASWTGNIATTANPQSNTELMNTDATSTNYRYAAKQYQGAVDADATVYRTGGASDGTTAISWKMNTTGATAPTFPTQTLVTPEIVAWNNTTGSSVTATVEFVSSGSVNDDEVWIELMYLSASGTPLGTYTTTRRGLVATAAAVPTSTAAWTNPPSTPVYQKLAVSFTPQMKGFIHAVVKLCKTTKIIYVDPKITLS